MYRKIKFKFRLRLILGYTKKSIELISKDLYRVFVAIIAYPVGICMCIFCREEKLEHFLDKKRAGKFQP